MSTGESYTVAEAAKVLQRSPKRVRQMLREGKLAALEATDPVRIGAEEVHRLRDSLRSGGSRPGPKPQQSPDSEVLRALVEELAEMRRELRAITARQTEETAKVEAALRDELAAERAERQRVEAELAALQAQPRRKFLGFGR